MTQTITETQKRNIIGMSAKEIVMNLLDPLDGGRDERYRIQGLRDKTSNLFSILCHPLGIDFQPIPTHILPNWGNDDAASIRQANASFAEYLIDQMKYDKVGRYDIIGDHVVNYTFYEDIEEEDDSPEVLFYIKKKRVKCKHIVMDARLRALPAEGVKLNKKAKWFISHIMAEPELAPHFGILTGTLVEKEEEIINRWREETELKKALDIIRKSAGQAVSSREKEIEAENNLVRRFMKLADPAICFGNDIVFYGWV